MTEAELFKILDEAKIPADKQALVLGWLGRGDGVAVYRNVAMDSGDFGHRKYMSFGSKQAQLEPEHCDGDGNPPKRLPDIGPQINWAYQLEGTVRRDA